MLGLEIHVRNCDLDIDLFFSSVEKGKGQRSGTKFGQKVRDIIFSRYPHLLLLILPLNLVDLFRKRRVGD